MTPPHFVYLILRDESPYVVYAEKSDADTFLDRLPDDKRHDYQKVQVYCIDHATWNVA